MTDIEHYPSDFVVPIIGLNEDKTCGPFLGSGVFVSKNSYLVTCNHILNDWQGDYGIAIQSENRLTDAIPLARCSNLDLALLTVEDYSPPISLPFGDIHNLALNEIVMSFNYGTTIVAGQNIDFSPTNQLGNITRFRNLQEFFNATGDGMLELSFPALRGASGSPVMNLRPPFELLGIVAANWDTELMPAQIETIHGEDGNVEETRRYFLPQALAIHVRHVRQLVADFESQ